MAAAPQMVLNPGRRGQQAAGLLERLRARVIGQDAALEQVVDALQTALAGLNSTQRPLANFLFLGPTGTGKTHVVETLGEVLFHDPRAVLSVDCAEFQHSHEIAKLIGSPPGYLGHRETHPILCQDALDAHQTAEYRLSLVLFDEIEKASDALWQLLLGILDRGVLTLGDNRKVSFSRALIFLTSNLGAGEMQHTLAPGLGFAPGQMPEYETRQRLEAAAVAAARRKFSPEFFNRLDHVVTFQPLAASELEQVLEIELAAVRARLARPEFGAPVGLECGPAARQWLLANGTDARYGARHLKRTIERYLVTPLASLLASGQIEGGNTVLVETCPAGLQFSRAATKLRARAA